LLAPAHKNNHYIITTGTPPGHPSSIFSQHDDHSDVAIKEHFIMDAHHGHRSAQKH
jgi:hypothetical protein